MNVTVKDAQADLVRLIRLALAGEEIILTEGDIALARIVPIQGRGFTTGLLKDCGLRVAPDFLGPMPASEVELWEGGSE